MREITETAYHIMKVSLTSFMKSRCSVSSQHKLPGIEEILGTISMQHLKDFYHVTDDHVKEFVEMKVSNGEWFRYGPYISDHPIEVM